jgi:hypothetical protein
MCLSLPAAAREQANIFGTYKTMVLISNQNPLSLPTEVAFHKNQEMDIAIAWLLLPRILF